MTTSTWRLGNVPDHTPDMYAPNTLHRPMMEILQAPTQAEIDDGSFNIGLGEGRRRVYYSIDRNNFVVPDRRRAYRAPTSDGLWMDMTVAMGLCNPGDIACRDDINHALICFGVPLTDECLDIAE